MKTDLNKEKALIKDAQSGNQKARTALMELYIPWLTGICGSKFGREDLVGEAMLIFESLIDKYNPNKGAQLGTFCYPHIINRIDELLAGTYLNGSIRKVRNRRRDFFHKYGYEPDPEELADEYGLKIKEVESAYKILDSREVTLDENMDFVDETYENRPELVVPNGLLTVDEKIYLELYLKGNTDKEIKNILNCSYNDCLIYYTNIKNKLKEYYKEESL